MLMLHHQLNELFVNGQTYENRDILKHLGFRWDPAIKTWHRTVSEERTLSYIIGMLKINGRNFSADASCRIDHIMTQQEIIDYRKELVELQKTIQRLR